MKFRGQLSAAEFFLWKLTNDITSQKASCEHLAINAPADIARLGYCDTPLTHQQINGRTSFKIDESKQSIAQIF